MCSLCCCDLIDASTGKLPGTVTTAQYAKEYGSDSVCVSTAHAKGRRCVLVDDLLATGGTLAAATTALTSAAADVIGGESARLVVVPLLV